jgi:hypothetical protein
MLCFLAMQSPLPPKGQDLAIFYSIDPGVATETITFKGFRLNGMVQ